MFNNVILIGLAGALGTILRYLVQKNLNTNFPWGTFAVNIAGCLIAGLAIGYFSRSFQEQKQLILVTGFCGGFTTFSAFSVEGIQMIQDQRWIQAMFYATASIAAGWMATFIGFKIIS